MLSRDTNLNIVWASGGVLLAAAVAMPGLAAKPPAAKGGKPTAKSAPGAQVFQQQCASCHGKNGEGTAAYSRPLAGDKSPAQLAQYIAQAMPPGPKHASPADAQKVAPYIYDTFYSPLAQERNRPARVALSRLTVRQLKNSVSDIVGSFRTATPEPTEEGLRAEYFKGKRIRKEERAFERVDAG
jgi:cytochrome c5